MIVLYLRSGVNDGKERNFMLTKEQITSVKGRGFLQNRGTECFSGRVVTVGGLFTPGELRALAQCAEQFGNGILK